MAFQLEEARSEPWAVFLTKVRVKSKEAKMFYRFKQKFLSRKTFLLIENVL